ncbi:MAG: ABC transporter transmembrane domain-containing protein [Pseudonocardia sp.]
MRLVRRLLGFATHRWSLFAATVAARVGYQVLAIVAAVTSAALIGAALQASAVSELTWLFVLLGFATVASGLCRWAETWVTHVAAYRILSDIRVAFYHAIERVAPAWVSGRRTGDLASSAIGDIEKLELFYAHMVAASISAVLVPGAALAILGAVDPRLALVMLPLVLLHASVPVWLSRRAADQGAAVRGSLGTVNADVVDGVQGLRELTLFRRGDDQARRIATGSRGLHALQLRYGRRAGAEHAANDAIMATGMLAVLTVAASLVAGGAVDVALYPVVVFLALFSFRPIADVIRTAGDWGVVRGAAERVFAVLDAAATVCDDGAPGGPADARRVQRRDLRVPARPSGADPTWRSPWSRRRPWRSSATPVPARAPARI